MAKITSYEEFAELWKEYCPNMTDETAVEVEVGEMGIELWPAKTNIPSNTFFYTERLVDFCRLFNLSSYVSYDLDKNKIYARIYSNDIDRLRREK